MAKIKTKALFVDVGGVLATNGWDHNLRALAAKTFRLDFQEMDVRHKETFDTFEIGKITLKEYLSRIVFYEKRSFAQAEFVKFMHAQSNPFPDMLKLMEEVRSAMASKSWLSAMKGGSLPTTGSRNSSWSSLSTCLLLAAMWDFASRIQPLLPGFRYRLRGSRGGHLFRRSRIIRRSRRNPRHQRAPSYQLQGNQENTRRIRREWL